MVGVYSLGVAMGSVEIAKTTARDRLAREQRVAMMALMMLAQQAEAARPKIPKKAAEEDFGELYFWGCTSWRRLAWLALRFEVVG